MIAQRTSSTTLRPLRILIAEDHADGRAVLCRILELHGHCVEAAADGAEAVLKGLACRPEVAILDIGLPRLDGFQVARKLRAAFGDGIFLIAHTGYGTADDYRQGREAGFDVYLVKPMDFGELNRWLVILASSAKPAPPTPLLP
jgi:DNA-binding response OmpR family regulator